MKPTLLLNDEPETVKLMLKEITGAAVRKSKARAGCNCDRWGHPCLDRKKTNEDRSNFITQSNNRGS
jgi:hypothetical protein